MKGFVLFFFIFPIIFFSCNSSDKLKEKGNSVIQKIELYKLKHGQLPDKISDLGIKDNLEGPIFYWKVDSVNYMVWFNTSLGESMTYYSDIRKWSYQDRSMGRDY